MNIKLFSFFRWSWKDLSFTFLELNDGHALFVLLLVATVELKPKRKLACFHYPHRQVLKVFKLGLDCLVGLVHQIVNDVKLA